MRNSPITWIIGGALIVVLMVVAIPYFTGQNGTNRPNNIAQNSIEEGIGGGPDTGISVTDIINNPQSYTNQTVTLVGEVDSLNSNSVFRLDQEGTIVGDEILVISQNPLPDDLMDGNNILDAADVRVQGTVSMMTTVEIERDFGIDLDPEIEAEIEEQQPVIIATQVTPLDENRSQ